MLSVVAVIIIIIFILGTSDPEGVLKITDIIIIIIIIIIDLLKCSYTTPKWPFQSDFEFQIVPEQRMISRYNK